MKNYTLEYFITRNTSRQEYIMADNFEAVRKIAKRLSFTNEKPVIAFDGEEWAKYENAKCTEATQAEYLTA